MIKRYQLKIKDVNGCIRKRERNVTKTTNFHIIAY